MENNLVTFDNTNGITGKEAISIIKQYFQTNFRQSALIKEYAYAGYWGVKYSYKEIIIFISSDRGGLESILIIDDDEFPLWQFDASIKNAYMATEKNILFSLEVIKRFFEITT